MPSIFEDHKGNRYVIALTLKRVREIRAKTAIDIMNEQDWQGLACSRSDQLAYIWWTIADQAASHGLNLESWEEAMSGKGVAGVACDALMQEIADFFQSYDLPKLEAMQRCVAKGLAKEQEAWSNQEMMEKLEAAMTHAINGQKSSNGQLLPESTGSR